LVIVATNVIVATRHFVGLNVYVICPFMDLRIEFFLTEIINDKLLCFATAGTDEHIGSRDKVLHR